jgi:stage IV sporulation protein B
VVGLELRDNSVTVADFDETLGARAKSSGVQIGDRIVQLDGHPVTNTEDVRRALRCSDGTVEAVLVRSGKEIRLSLTPEITTDGPKLGLYLRQGVTGIGTVTWYDPETGRFATLGHGVNDSSGKLLRLTGGQAYYARVMTVKKGAVGEPGQLMGALESRIPAGTLTANTPQGVFGISESGWVGEPVEIAAARDVKAGPAVIRSTVSGNKVEEYSVEIVKVYSKSRSGGRNLLLKVTDPALLAATGGIVQGMSGSPIIQDGKLVGAVTHVLVNDPTTGYGIFIENMLEAAS